jgi:hypothetical protein
MTINGFEIFPDAVTLRNNARAFLIVHNEIRSIENAILVAADNGLVDAIVTNTYMTSTAVATPVTVSNIDILANTLTVTNHGLLPGAELYFQSDDQFPQPIIPDQPFYAIVNNVNEFQLSSTYVGAFSGDVLNITDPGLGNLTYISPTPAELYRLTWKGIRMDRALVDHMRGVITHFEGLGYRIQRQSNPTQDKVFWWKISW